jgi:hypothetical protein
MKFPFGGEMQDKLKTKTSQKSEYFQNYCIFEKENQAGVAHLVLLFKDSNRLVTCSTIFGVGNSNIGTSLKLQNLTWHP